MAIKVYFNDNSSSVDPMYIVGLKQSVHSLGDSFTLGGTVCRTFEIDVIKSAGIAQPSKIVLMDQSSGGINNPYAVLTSIEVDDTNDAYYKYKAAEKFIDMTTVYKWSQDDNTAQKALAKVCSVYNLGTAPTKLDDNTNLYGTNIPVSLDDTVSPRDFIGWIAEINAGYAYLDAEGHLQFSKYKKASVGSISKEVCSTYKLGTEHKITRVCYNGLEPYQAGDQTGETVYVNTDNRLFTDTAGTHPKPNDIIQHIYDNIKNFTFYNLSVEKCPVLSNARAGQLITIGDKPTITQINWNYNGDWLGGYDLQLNIVKEQETSVVNDFEKYVASIRVQIDHVEQNLEIVGQNVSALQEDSIHFHVDAPTSQVWVTNQDTLHPTAYTSFKGDGMRIYVPESSTPVAEATKDQFNCNEGLGVQKWAIKQGKSDSILLFYRRRDN